MKIIPLIILSVVESFSFLALKEHFLNESKRKFAAVAVIHFILSIWTWILLIKVLFYKGYYDDRQNIHNQM